MSHYVASVRRLVLAGALLPAAAHTWAAAADFETPEYRAQEDLALINASQAYALGYTGLGVTVGVLGSGMDGRHREFLGKIVGGYDLVLNRPVGAGDGIDVDGHGSHVGGHHRRTPRWRRYARRRLRRAAHIGAHERGVRQSGRRHRARLEHPRGLPPSHHQQKPRLQQLLSDHRSALQHHRLHPSGRGRHTSGDGAGTAQRGEVGRADGVRNSSPSRARA